MNRVYAETRVEEVKGALSPAGCGSQNHRLFARALRRALASLAPRPHSGHTERIGIKEFSLGKDFQTVHRSAQVRGQGGLRNLSAGPGISFEIGIEK